ncbi:hypothetical protein ABPG74_010235 [Tetrahymena malaccensis]
MRQEISKSMIRRVQLRHSISDVVRLQISSLRFSICFLIKRKQVERSNMKLALLLEFLLKENQVENQLLFKYWLHLKSSQYVSLFVHCQNSYQELSTRALSLTSTERKTTSECRQILNRIFFKSLRFVLIFERNLLEFQFLLFFKNFFLCFFLILDQLLFIFQKTSDGAEDLKKMFYQI